MQRKGPRHGEKEHFQRHIESRSKLEVPAGVHLVAGRRPIEELLRLAPKRVRKIYFGNDLDQRGTELIKSAEALKIPHQIRSSGELTQISNSSSHQGVVALVEDIPALEIREFLQRDVSSELVIALDGVEDPHNLGAVMRAGECFGAHAIMWSKNRGSPMTTTVTKSSAGASEILPQIQPANLADAIRKFREAGYWSVGAALGQNSQKLDSFSWPDKCLLVLGAEGEGLRKLTIELCDFLVEIPMFGQVGSLNVSQAASVLGYAWATRLKRGIIE